MHYLGSSLAQPLHCRASSPSVFLFRHHPYKPCCTTASRVTASWHSLRITPRCSGVGFTASIPLTDGVHTMRIQPHPDRGPPTTAVLRALDTMTNVLAPSHKSRFQAASYTPLAASGLPIFFAAHRKSGTSCSICRSQESNLTTPALRCTSSGIYARLVTLQREACRGCPKASVPHAGLAPAHTLRTRGAHLPFGSSCAACGRHLSRRWCLIRDDHMGRHRVARLKEECLLKNIHYTYFSRFFEKKVPTFRSRPILQPDRL